MTRMPTEARRRLGAKLLLIRDSKGLTLEELAEVLGYASRGNFSNFESGKVIPSAAVLAAYSERMGADPKELGDLRAAALAERNLERRAAAEANQQLNRGAEAEAPGAARDSVESPDDDRPGEVAGWGRKKLHGGFPADHSRGDDDGNEARRSYRRRVVMGVVAVATALAIVSFGVFAQRSSRDRQGVGRAGGSVPGLEEDGRNKSPLKGATVVGMASTPSGRGYWLAAADGKSFSFGDAQDFGSRAGQHLRAPLVLCLGFRW